MYFSSAGYHNEYQNPLSVKPSCILSLNFWEASEGIQLGFTDSGLWYSLWYPAEEKYKPYDSSSIRLLHGYVIRKKDGKKMLISGYARLGDELLYIFFKGDPHNYTPKEMLADFTWEDGTPFGQEVKE